MPASNYYWYDWYTGWGWFLWFGMLLLIFSGLGNWRYTYSAHRRYLDGATDKDAMDLLNERYARGEIKHDEYGIIKSEITKSRSMTERFAIKESAKLHPTTNS